MDFLAYIAIIFIGIALLISAILNEGQFTRALELLANILAYIVVAFCAFFYAFRSRRNQVWYIVAYFVAITLIVIFLILPLFQ